MKNRELLKLTDVKKIYGDGSGNRAEVLSGVSLTVEEGASVSVSGPSGSGKSTLLNIMGALDRPTSGRVSFRSEDISALPDEKLSFFRNRSIGFIFQLHHLIPQCSVIENVLIPTLPYPAGSREEAHEEALKLIHAVGLSGRVNHKPAELSGGERQRTAVARALINSPEIILADEPTGSLDSRTAGEISELILRQNAEKNIALVVVTHSGPLAEKLKKNYTLDNGLLERNR